MPKIAISYRRADSEAMTGRIFDRLIAHYGKEAIFRDIDDIPPGIDFRVHINQTLLKTHILLAIVGPQWVGMSSDGSADRIQEETDPVRVEVETALRRRVPLIPVLIGVTKMPSSDQLPPGLKDFAFRNAVKVDTGQDFDYHMDRLIRSMDAILEQEPKSPPSRETKPPAAPKSSTPGPVKNVPEVDTPLYSWYLTPAADPFKPICTPVPPVQKLPPPVTLFTAGSGFIVIIALPDILLVQSVAAFVALTV